MIIRYVWPAVTVTGSQVSPWQVPAPGFIPTAVPFEFA
jgi:hypothetical protein